MQERLQKFLAQAGVASRRQAEQYIVEGRVTVNGQVARELGVKVDPAKDAVKVDGKRVLGEDHAYVLLFKPKGTICTLDDPENRPTVMDLVKGVKARLFPVGRLDFDTTGALLLTNDGELANLLMHPRHRFTKTYLAKVKGIPTEERLEKLRRGVNIEGVRTSPADVRLVAVKEKNSLVELILREGRNRQVKRMFLEIGHPVLRLHRPAYAFLSLEGLEPGQWRSLGADEVKRLRAAAARSGESDQGPAAGFQQRIARPLREPRAVSDRSPRPAAREGARPGQPGKPRMARAGKKAYTKPAPREGAEGGRPGFTYKPASGRPGAKPYASREGGPREAGRPGGKPYASREGGPREGGRPAAKPYPSREGAPRSGPARDGGPREGGSAGPKPRKLGPRESGPRGPQAGPRKGGPGGRPSGPRKRPS
jgi:pseudouridine synthase